jgi:hypothetical protein
MLHIAILTVALVTGDCPECDRGAWGVIGAPAGQVGSGAPMARALVPPPPLIKHPSVLQVIPCPVVRCVGQGCFSVTRPYLPGVPVYNYRQDFNYPWSQAPSALRPVGVVGGSGYELIDEPEVVPGPLLEGHLRGKSKTRLTARRADGVLIYDTVRASTHRRSVSSRPVRR